MSSSPPVPKKRAPLPKHLTTMIRNHAVGSCAVHALSGLSFESAAEVRLLLENFPAYPLYPHNGGYLVASAVEGRQRRQVDFMLEGGFTILARFNNPVHEGTVVLLLGAVLPGGERLRTPVAPGQTNVIPLKGVL